MLVVLFMFLETQQRQARSGLNNFIYEKLNPPLLLVCPIYPDRAMTIKNTEYSSVLPTVLDLVDAEKLAYQIFNALYRQDEKGAWFEWSLKPYFQNFMSLSSIDTRYNRDSIDPSKRGFGSTRIKIICNGNELHGTRSLSNTDMLVRFEMISEDGSLFKIKRDEDNCLTAENRKGEISLMFRKCGLRPEQEFKFVSVMKAACILGMNDLCDSKEGVIEQCEANVMQKAMSLC